MTVEAGGLVGHLIPVADVRAIVNTVSSRAVTAARMLRIVSILLQPLPGFPIWLLFGRRQTERQACLTAL